MNTKDTNERELSKAMAEANRRIAQQRADEADQN
jgi:hypothetical protein